MRQKRAKTYRKALALYMRHFAFRLPLQLLFDSALVLALAKQRLAPADVPARLADVLQVRAAAPLGHRRPKAEGGEVKCMITQCAINELYRRQKDGDVEARAVDMAKTFERRRCGHREAIAGDECVRQSMGPTNKHRYVLCANSFALRAWVRAEVPGVPVVHANERSVLVLEPISEKTRERIDNLEVDKLRTDAHEASALGLSASSVAGSSRGATGDIVGLDAADAAEGSTPASAAAAAAVPGAKKRRAKEPNPLSMRKKKSAPTAAEAQQGAKSGEKRKRDDGAAPQGATATAAKDGAPARRRRKRGAGGSGAGGGGDDGAAKTTAEAAT